MSKEREFGHKGPIIRRDSGLEVPVFDASPFSEGSRELTPITPETLYEDNHSTKAESARSRWRENRAARNLTLVFLCADPREITPNPEQAEEVRKIAAGGDEVKQYAPLLNDRGVKNILVMSHFDSEAYEEGKRPPGCGGLDAKAKVFGQEQEPKGDIETYLKKGIPHPDPILQAYHSAAMIARVTDKVVNAALQDHRTGNIYPLGGFSAKDSAYIMCIDPDLIFHGKYNPEEIYRESVVPHLPDRQLNPAMLSFLEQYRDAQKKFAKKRPNFFDSQKIINPRIVTLSTDIRPSGKIKFDQYGEPNTIFKLNVPRKKIDDTDFVIENSYLEEALQQAEYPLKHSTENCETPGTSFCDTDTFYIETRSFDYSIEIAEKILKRRWMQEWLKRKPGQIIVSEARAGEIRRIEQVA